MMHLIGEEKEGGRGREKEEEVRRRGREEKKPEENLKEKKLVPGRDHRHGPEPELVPAQRRRDQHVPPRSHPAVDAQHHALAELVRDELLMRLGESHLDGAAAMLDRADGARTGPAVVAADLDDVGVGLGDARGDRADAFLTRV